MLNHLLIQEGATHPPTRATYLRRETLAPHHRRTTLSNAPRTTRRLKGADPYSAMRIYMPGRGRTRAGRCATGFPNEREFAGPSVRILIPLAERSAPSRRRVSFESFSRECLCEIPARRIARSSRDPPIASCPLTFILPERMSDVGGVSKFIPT